MLNLNKENYNFVSGTEMHHDGEFWEGYTIPKESIDATPSECIDCGEWFKKGDKFYRVYRVWCCGDPDGHWTESKEVGVICKSCLQKALKNRKFKGVLIAQEVFKYL